MERYFWHPLRNSGGLTFMQVTSVCGGGTIVVVAVTSNLSNQRTRKYSLKGMDPDCPFVPFT